MVEVAIHDVLVESVGDPGQVLGGDPRLYEAFAGALPEEKQETLRRALEAAAYRVILLKETAGDRALPIWVGPFEGDDIARRLSKGTTKRPLTADLATTLLDFGRVRVERAVVSRLHETVFYATLTVKSEGDGVSHEIDCRPSDALSLAVRLGVPVYVAEEVMAQAGERPTADGGYRPSRPECADRDVVWRSLTA
jgi:bifunctional DNase/RNase